MDAAAKLRSMDKNVPIVFITNMANYAVKGYSVSAFDFIIKPVSYYGFSTMMDRLLRIMKINAENIVLKTIDGIKKVYLNEIYYLEVRDHEITYHTQTEKIVVWGSLKTEEKKLPEKSFYRCSSCYLLNLRHVEEVIGNDVLIFGNKIPISRAKKQDFMQKLLEYHSEVS